MSVIVRIYDPRSSSSSDTSEDPVDVTLVAASDLERFRVAQTPYQGLGIPVPTKESR